MSKNEKKYHDFIRSALDAGFTDLQVNWLEKYLYDDVIDKDKETL